MLWQMQRHNPPATAGGGREGSTARGIGWVLFCGSKSRIPGQMEKREKLFIGGAQAPGLPAGRGGLPRVSWSELSMRL